VCTCKNDNVPVDRAHDTVSKIMRVHELVGQAGKTRWALGWALVVVVVGLVYWQCTAGARKLKRMIPPGPPGSVGWPVLGEMLSYLCAKEITTRVAKYGEVGNIRYFGNFHICNCAQNTFLIHMCN
jgi:hypothetical protein